MSYGRSPKGYVLGLLERFSCEDAEIRPPFTGRQITEGINGYYGTAYNGGAIGKAIRELVDSGELYVVAGHGPRGGNGYTITPPTPSAQSARSGKEHSDEA